MSHVTPIVVAGVTSHATGRTDEMHEEPQGSRVWSLADYSQGWKRVGQ